MSARVEFRYPRDLLIRYMDEPPARGDVVRGRRHELLFVREVRSDETGGYVATCVPAPDYVSEARRIAAAGRRLAKDVGRRAREVREFVAARRQELAAALPGREGAYAQAVRFEERFRLSRG